MVVLRSGRKINPSSGSSSIAKKFKYRIFNCPEERAASHKKALSHLYPKKVPREKWPDHKINMQLAEEALNYFNQPQNYKLLKVHYVKVIPFGHFMLYHFNFTAENTHVAAASKEMFFTELTNSRKGVSVRLCVSLGPENSLSGLKLNGCCYCLQHNKVWHPRNGGFVRGLDSVYKTVQDICDINQNNAVSDHEKHLPNDFGSEPKKERENISEQVDDASLYAIAIEALKFYNQDWPIYYDIYYELVKPGFVTRVILPTCVLFHVNFTAKATDDATTSEENFFAEVKSTGGAFSCDLCMILEPCDLILEDETDETVDKTNGCCYCNEFNNVLHPIVGRFVRGGDSFYIPVEELRKTALI